MFRYVIYCILAIVLVASVATADQKMVGHMTPLPEEKLANPVTLDCGATVQEARGISLDYAKLNSMCTHALSNFFKFADAKGLKYNHTRSFDWDLSFLPEHSCYRCLNDEQYRFKHRFVKGHLIGYTDKDNQYAFMSNIQDQEFNDTFVHELFHSMSMYYGIYGNHPGNNAEKTAHDEKLAVEFTRWLGYSR